MVVISDTTAITNLIKINLLYRHSKTSRYARDYAFLKLLKRYTSRPLEMRYFFFFRLRTLGFVAFAPRFSFGAGAGGGFCAY